MAAKPAPARLANLYQCTVADSQTVGAYRLVSFLSREIAAEAQPGHFLMMRPAGPALDPLLPRPLGVHDVDLDLVSVLIEPVGKGTRLLADLQVGDQLDVLGPLGRGFDLMGGTGPAVVVGGGIGVAPLKLLARRLKERGRQVRCILGFASGAQAVSAGLFQDFPVEVLTEDGSVGSRGLVSEPLPGCLAPSWAEARQPDGIEPFAEVFACGPRAMLREVARISRQCGVRAQVSVDAPMACGIGACQGCVVETPGGYRKSCSDGPVFEAEELGWI